jgi:hypothetical protein
MFPHGEVGYYYEPRMGDDHLMCLAYYQQMLQNRPRSLHPLPIFGRLYHEYALDQWVKVENMRLDYIHTHQEEVRAQVYSGIMDFLLASGDVSLESARRAGKKVTILPASFIGAVEKLPFYTCQG